jgi:O-antigen ligase
MMAARPWLGVGLGNYAAAYADYRLANWPISLGHAHNIYLHTWAETGLLGLAAYVGFWAAAIILTVRTLRRTTGWRRGLAVGLLAAWVHLLTHQIVDNLHVNNNDLLLGVYLGILYALNLARNQSRDQITHPRAAAAH